MFFAKIAKTNDAANYSGIFFSCGRLKNYIFFHAVPVGGIK